MYHARGYSQYCHCNAEDTDTHTVGIGIHCKRMINCQFTITVFTRHY